ncbi:MAG TPA: HAMP domain-containing sensor histidine kinase [Thauera sp.]|nr:HAMP domain-containing sensor histidine kinase [Thauera sp.]HRA80208.1 HAMP domain-containing sensor histidine kinase [Thauera sp.]
MTILRLLAANSPNWPEVALVVARDPALSLALLLAQPLADGELADGLNTVLRRRLERIGTDLMRAWLLGLGNTANPGEAAPELALLRAECALHLAIETHYVRPDEAYLAGLWRGFGHARPTRQDTGDARTAVPHGPPPRPLAALIHDCGLPASLGDALELGAVMEEQFGGAHPLLPLVAAAERLADPQWQHHLPEIARLSGLHEGVLTSMRTDVAFIVSGHAAYPPPPPLPVGLPSRLPAAITDDPYRSAGMLGLLTAAFVDLDPQQVGDRLAIACPLFGLPAMPALLAADGEGRLWSMLPAPNAGIAALIDELRLRLDDDNSAIALCARSEHASNVSFHGKHVGRSLADWQVARWLGQKGLCCLPLTTNGQATVAVVGVEPDNALGSELRWRYAALLGAAARSLRAAARQRNEIAAREAVLHQHFHSHMRKITHEVTNPLTVIKSRLEMLGMQRPDDMPLQDEMVLLNTELDRIDNLLRSASKLPLETIEVPRCRVPELLLDMRSIYGDALFRERGIQLELRAAKDLPAAAMPASALKQVLLNLFRNASEALLPGQRLVVSASSQVTVDGQASLEIRLVDNGPGLPPERAADLFASRTSAKGDRHQGVGLTLVREILSQWGATILCRSQASSGTSFQLFLPLEQSS